MLGTFLEKCGWWSLGGAVVGLMALATYPVTSPWWARVWPHVADAAMATVVGTAMALILRRVLPGFADVLVYLRDRLFAALNGGGDVRVPTQVLRALAWTTAARRKLFVERRLEELEMASRDPRPFIAMCFTDLSIAFLFGVSLLAGQAARLWEPILVPIAGVLQAMTPLLPWVSHDATAGWIVREINTILFAALSAMGYLFRRNIKRNGDPYELDHARKRFVAELERTHPQQKKFDGDTDDHARAMLEGMRAPTLPTPAATPASPSTPPPAIGPGGAPAEMPARAPAAAPAAASATAAKREAWIKGTVERWPHSAYFGFIRVADDMQERHRLPYAMFYANVRQLVRRADETTTPDPGSDVYFITGAQQKQETGNALLVLVEGARHVGTIKRVRELTPGMPKVAFVTITDKSEHEIDLLVWNNDDGTSPLFDETDVGRVLEFGIREQRGRLVASDPRFR